MMVYWMRLLIEKTWSWTKVLKCEKEASCSLFNYEEASLLLSLQTYS